MNLRDRINEKVTQKKNEASAEKEVIRKAEREWEAGGKTRAKKDLEKIEKEIEKEAVKKYDYQQQYKNTSVDVTAYGVEGREFLKKHFEKMGFKVEIKWFPEYTDSEWSNPAGYTMKVEF